MDDALSAFLSEESTQQFETIDCLRLNLNKGEVELRSKGIPEVRGGSLRRLVQILCSNVQGTLKYRRAFLLMLPTICSSEDFFDLLTSSYLEETNLKDGTATTVSQNQTIEVLCDWIGDYFQLDWENNELKQKLLSFSSTLKSSANRTIQEQGSRLEDEIQSPTREPLCSRNLVMFPFSGEDRFKLGKCESGDFNLNSWPADVIASTLTLFAFSLFKNLKDREYLAWLKGKKASEDEYQNINRLVDLYNRVAAWGSSEIVTKVRLKDRVAAFEKMVEIGSLLFSMKNFQCLSALVSALTSSWVVRMNRTLKEVSVGSLAKLKELEQQLSFEKNFKSYRELIDKSTPPCIPYLGIYQKDILFLSDGNPDTVNGDLINFSKRMRIAEVILDAGLCRVKDYSLAANPKVIAWLFSSPILEEKELHSWSRRVDPKDPELVIEQLVQGELDQLERENEFVQKIKKLEEELAEAKKRIAILEGRGNDEEKREGEDTGGNKEKEEGKKEVEGKEKGEEREIELEKGDDISGQEEGKDEDKKKGDEEGEKEGEKKEDQEKAQISDEKETPKRNGKKKSKRMEKKEMGSRVLYTYYVSSENEAILDPAKWSVGEVCQWIEDTIGEEWVSVFSKFHVLG